MAVLILRRGVQFGHATGQVGDEHQGVVAKAFFTARRVQNFTRPTGSGHQRLRVLGVTQGHQGADKLGRADRETECPNAPSIAGPS